MEVMKLYTVKEVAKILRVNPDTVYKLIKSGQIPAVRIGTTKVRPEDLDKFLNLCKI